MNMALSLWMQIGLGLGFSLVIAAGAYFLHALSFSGAAAAVLLGTVVFGLGGLPWAVLLIAFFVTSSGLSVVLKKRKKRLNEKFSKGSRRDWAQVLANGGAAGLMVILHGCWPLSPAPWMLFAAALAAANADTWATELGVLVSHSPRLITNGKKVEPGTSGAVSVGGLLAAACGAGLIAFLAAFPGWVVCSGGQMFSPAFVFCGVLAAGLLGSLADSWLGATVQAIYYCPDCLKETERFPLHHCGARTSLVRGWKWLDNDRVNTLCTFSAVAVMLLTILLFNAG